MDPERPHQSSSSSTRNELFICFASRLSSMKISSKSILNPGSSRTLRSNGSMKGGCRASPMFSDGKKKGCANENPEPSSPKVTCIGQVKVKTKRHGKKFRPFRSKRNGEVNFRKADHNVNIVNNESNTSDDMGHSLSNNSHHHHQQQQQQEGKKKWVHLPLTICEALRAFGAEFNCFLPCSSSSCMAKQRDKEDKTGSRSGGNNGNGNGSSQRRHVFEDIEINDCVNEKMGYEEDQDQDQSRVNICIPPKNDLLLMRCRSDPVKMAALANKFWETPLPKDEEQEVNGDAVKFEQEMERQEATEEQESPEAETITECEDQEEKNEVDEGQQGSTMKEEILTQVPFDLQKLHGEDQAVVEETETTQERPELECPETMEPHPEDESKGSECQQNLLPDCLLLMMCEPKLSMEVSKETWVSSRDFVRWLPERKKHPLVKQKDGGDEAPKGRISIDYNAAAVSLQPPRSSCSFPAAAPPPMVTAATAGNGNGTGGVASTAATMIQQKLVAGKGYEPFVLTRCLSEPMKSSAKLAPDPDSCF